MAEIFARTLGQDVGAILDHAIAYGCLSASWHAEDGNAVDASRELSVAAAFARCGRPACECGDQPARQEACPCHVVRPITPLTGRRELGLGARRHGKDTELDYGDRHSRCCQSRAVRQRRVGPAADPRAGRHLCRGAFGPAGQDRRLRLRPRHPCRDAGARACRCPGTVGAACLVGARLRHREVRGRRLPDLARPQEDLRPRRNCRCRRSVERLWTRAAVPRRLRRQPAQSEDGAVLPRPSCRSSSIRAAAMWRCRSLSWACSSRCSASSATAAMCWRPAPPAIG